MFSFCFLSFPLCVSIISSHRLLVSVVGWFGFCVLNWWGQFIEKKAKWYRSRLGGLVSKVKNPEVRRIFFLKTVKTEGEI